MQRTSTRSASSNAPCTRPSGSTRPRTGKRLLFLSLARTHTHKLAARCFVSTCRNIIFLTNHHLPGRSQLRCRTAVSGVGVRCGHVYPSSSPPVAPQPARSTGASSRHVCVLALWLHARHDTSLAHAPKTMSYKRAVAARHASEKTIRNNDEDVMEGMEHE